MCWWAGRGRIQSSFVDPGRHRRWKGGNNPRHLWICARERNCMCQTTALGSDAVTLSGLGVCMLPCWGSSAVLCVFRVSRWKAEYYIPVSAELRRFWFSAVSYSMTANFSRMGKNFLLRGFSGVLNSFHCIVSCPCRAYRLFLLYLEFLSVVFFFFVKSVGTSETSTVLQPLF